MAASAPAKNNITCQSCGFTKNPSGSVRCASCGFKLEEFAKGRVTDDARDRRFQQEGVDVKWMGIAICVQAVLTAAVVFGIPMLVSSVDFEGGNGMVACIPIWFVGGLLVGLISPGRTFVEPVIGSFIVAIPATYLLVQSQTVRTMPPFLYVVMATIGILFTLIGSYAGERIQLGPPPKPQD
jgi:DNA-directed RNA polymerase subunit RPC12/RpoP